MQIPFITEPAYRSSSIWCAETRAGIVAELSRKRYTPIDIDGADYRNFDYDSLFSDGVRMVAVIGTSPSWVPDALEFFREKDVDVLLVSYQPPENAAVRGVVRIDYVTGVTTLLGHLAECGCRRCALYGCFVNSSADLIKRRAYFEYAPRLGFEEPVSFENRSGLADCWSDFVREADRFDSVLCVNDIAAASLINHLRRAGYRVPEQLAVVCFGSSAISRFYSPAITSLSLDNSELGRQTVSMYAYLARSDRSVSVSVRVAGSLNILGSTRPKPDAVAAAPHAVLSPVASSFYEDEEVKAFITLENILGACDELDLRILTRMMDDDKTERIAEALSLAPETVRYRVRRILQTVGMNSRAELIDRIRGNDFGEALTLLAKEDHTS